MTLLESLSPTLTEISTRHQSLMVFIQKAEKQLPVLHQKLETAQAKDVAKIREAIQLISRHIDKNVQEAADLQDVAGALLIQCEDDETGTAGTAITELRGMISKGQEVEDGLGNLQAMIGEIIVVLDKKLNAAQVSPIEQNVAIQHGEKPPISEPSLEFEQRLQEQQIEPRFEQSVTVQNPPPPPPVPRTPGEQVREQTIQTPTQLESTIETLKTELEEAKQQLLEEMEFNRKQTELISEIEEDVGRAERTHEEDIAAMRAENSRLKQELVNEEALMKTQECEECKTLHSQLQQAREDFELLREDYQKLSNDNKLLSEESEIEIKELQHQLLELQSIAQREALKQSQHNTEEAQRREADAAMQLVRSPNRVRRYDSVQTQLQAQYKAIQERAREEDDELSDPDDARVVCDRSQVGNTQRKHTAELDEYDIMVMVKEKEEMKQMIESLKTVLVKMSKNVSPEPAERMYRANWQ